MKTIINALTNEFNTNGSIYFNITEYTQQFYDNDLLDSDKKPYVASILNELSLPRIENYYTTRRREFELLIKTRFSILDDVKQVISLSQEFEASNNKYYLSDLIITDIAIEDLGDDKVKVAYGRLTIGVIVPTFITGKDVKLSIDGTPVNFVREGTTIDKSLIPNKPFGTNNSNVATGRESTFVFMLDGNAKTSAIFTDIQNNTYNKKYTFSINYISTTITVDLVLRSGIINYATSEDIITFSAVFERALDRKTITIDSISIPVISYTTAMNVDPIVKTKNGVTKMIGGKPSRTFTFVLENDNSTIINDIIGEYNVYTARDFSISFVINSTTITTNCKVFNVLLSASENPFAILNVTFMES